MRVIKDLLRNLLKKLQRIKKMENLIKKVEEIIEEEKFIKVSTHLLGFHGDQYLLTFINFLLLKSNYFIETGTRRGVTLKYVADGYTHLKLFSCEPNEEFFNEAKEALTGFDNCKIYNERSQDFLPKVLDMLDLKDNLGLFFLDAHGKGFEWPLRQEIQEITNKVKKAIILIDDFKVPNNPQFNYDVYDGQECSMSFIKNSLNSQRKYEVIYPNYKIFTSNYHQYRGYVIILMGFRSEDIKIPTQLYENYKRIDM